MKLFESNTQTIGSRIFEVMDFPLNLSKIIVEPYLIAENKEEEIPEHYKILFDFQNQFVFDIGSFEIIILQEDLRNNIPVAYARVEVLNAMTGDVIDTIVYTIRFNSETEEFKRLKKCVITNTTLHTK